MKKIFLPGLLLPMIATAQEVTSIISPGYLALIRNNSTDTIKHKPADSATSISKATLHYRGYNYSGGTVIEKISIEKDNTVILHPVSAKDLSIAGNLSAVVEVQHFNRTPAVQNEYVQGRSRNGSLTWYGPETNELFSYGPPISTLNFKGNNYPYDVNGGLVAAGTGNGKSAIAYSPSIFRTAALFSTALTLQTKYRTGYKRQLTSTIKAKQSRENSLIVSNKNKTDNFSALLEGIINGFTISGSYNYFNENFSNSNRAGFLNRVYQNALLSPVSFDNSQGNTTGTTQRSYSQLADNPFFLLADKGHLFLQHQNTGNFILEQKSRDFKIRITQSYESLQQQSNEGYQPGTAFYQNGIVLQRNKRDQNYFLDANAQYTIHFNDYDWNALITANYIYANDHSAIAYPHNNTFYHYQRSSHDAALSFSPTYRHDNFVTGLSLLNKMYASNTATASNFFLPAVSCFTRFNDLFDIDNLALKLTGNYSRFNNELPISLSFAQTNSVQLKLADALLYLPLTEVNSFNNLLPVEHREYSTGMELSYKNKIVLSFDWFSRHTSNDIFPIIDAGKLQLANVADHVNKGVELELKLNPWLNPYKISFSNTISFVSYRSKVTDVKVGHNFTPIAGFSDVHKAIVKGEPQGVIVGNTFLKDAVNNIIIGTDGFPLVNNTLSVIGNPAPDFIMKMSHRVSWKKWDLNIDWEWKKGGDIWNGTTASFDYYGRSAASAALRNITNYIFNGVQQSGTHNNVPVSFYDPTLPLEKNRWVRYGQSGVAEAYIQKASCIRVNNISVSFTPKLKKYPRAITFTLYASNIILWSAYKGVDPDQLLNDQPGTSGLDFFNLPSYRSVGFSASIQF